MALGLALHTTSPDLGLAIGDGLTAPRQQCWHLDRALSNQLHSYLLAFLAPQPFADVGYIAVANGPGGFTSTRIGVVTARTLGQQLDCPVYGISTLAAIAYATAQSDQIDSGLIAVEMPAQRGELFGAIYAVHKATPPTLPGSAPSDAVRSVQVHTVDAVYQPGVWQQQVASLDVLQRVQIPKAAGLGHTAIAVLELAQQQAQQGLTPHWSEVVPFYGQHPVTL